MSLAFLRVISFEELFHEHHSSVKVGFVSPFSLAYSILYKAATTWLQQELNPTVRVQNEVTISDASLNKNHKLLLLVIDFLRWGH